MEFTNTWFETTAKANWEDLLPKLRPRKVLEIGSFEGKSAAYLIEHVGAEYPFELHCVDDWAADGAEYGVTDMAVVKRHFYENTREAGDRAVHVVTVYLHEQKSEAALAKMKDEHAGSFDFVYVDGSHFGLDVLKDAEGAFALTRVGGVIGFDDYGWHAGDPLKGPKLAIDLFLNEYAGRVKRLPYANGQVYVEKIA